MKPVTITAGGTAKPKLNRDGKTIVVSIPISLQRTGGEEGGHTGKCRTLVTAASSRRQHDRQGVGSGASLARHAGIEALRDGARSGKV